MTQYNKPAQFPTPYVPVGERPFIGDSFGNLMRGVAQDTPTPDVIVTGGGGGGGPPTSVSVVAEIPRHPWRIMIENVYDTSDPPVWVSASATIWPGSVVYQGYNSFTSVHTVTAVGSTFTPVDGFFLYLAGVVNSSNNITSITLTQASSLPARMIFSGLVQSDFIVPIGKYVQLADNSFVADQWQVGQLTAVTICVLDGVTAKQAKYLV